jgi:hypothetical protein
MRAHEVYELTTRGGTTDFAAAVRVCERVGSYCLLGGLAVNCYVEPVYTVDADFVVVASKYDELKRELAKSGFSLTEFPYSINAHSATSDLRIQFTTDPRYQAFIERAQEKEVLGVKVRVAALEDVVQGKLWAYSDPERRLTKRKKDELDLLRLAEAYPHLRNGYPPELRQQFE